MGESIYFKDNFFSAGTTEIYNADQEQIGLLDLKSAFSSGVQVLDLEGNIKAKGAFPFLSGKWVIKDQNDEEIGKLRRRFSFFSKKYSYHSSNHGEYEIKSEAFSKEYDILS